jgi:hypothetical protein
LVRATPHPLSGIRTAQTNLDRRDEALRLNIEVLESLRLGLPDASKIAIFEMQVFTYRFLPLRHYKMSKGNI